MKKILTGLAAVALMAFGGAFALQPAECSALASTTDGKAAVRSDLTSTKGSNETNAMDAVKVIINVVLGVIGLISVVMIIVGGIGFATSQGDAAKVKKGRDTILYGVIGLVVALLAFAIVNFVLTNIFGTSI